MSGMMTIIVIKTSMQIMGPLDGLFFLCYGCSDTIEDT
jgi:hypothetical protein